LLPERGKITTITSNMEDFHLVRYGVWTYKVPARKFLSTTWFKHSLETILDIWQLTGIARSSSKYWFYGLLFGTALRAVIEGLRLRGYAKFVKEVPYLHI
jgi:hypothetical protein